MLAYEITISPRKNLHFKGPVVIEIHFFKIKKPSNNLHAGVIEELSLTGNIRQKIISLSNSLLSFISLRDLDISRNNISSLEGLQFCQVSKVV